MLKSLFGIVTDIAKVVIAPVEIAADMTRTLTKPVADMADDLKKEIKDGLKDLTE